MVREYLQQNVYEALQSRLKFIFEEFDNIYISFSGGKDSGLLLNLTLDFRDKYYPDKTVGVFHQDFEAQYTVTTEYIEKCSGIRGMTRKKTAGYAPCRRKSM